MPLIHDKHGYHFGKVAGNPLPGNCFEHAGKVWEIYDSPGETRAKQIHFFRERGTKGKGGKTYSMKMIELVEKLTGETI